jgi:hypothetical protein
MPREQFRANCQVITYVTTSYVQTRSRTPVLEQSKKIILGPTKTALG